MLRPCAGWISASTLTVGEPVPRNSSRFNDSSRPMEVTRSDDASNAAWDKRLTQVILRQHHRALAAIRRKRLQKSACIEKQHFELNQLENEEARVSRLILECLEHQVDSLATSIRFSRVQAGLVQSNIPPNNAKTRDDLFSAARKRDPGAQHAAGHACCSGTCDDIAYEYDNCDT